MHILLLELTKIKISEFVFTYKNINMLNIPMSGKWPLAYDLKMIYILCSHKEKGDAYRRLHSMKTYG